MTTMTTSPVVRTDSDQGLRWAGAAGLGFVGLIVLQNILRAGAPHLDAPTDDVIRYFRDHRALESFLMVTFTFGGVALARFGGGVWRAVSTRAPDARDWLMTGVLGLGGILALFASMVACELGMLVAADETTASSVVPTLWTLHNALFALLNVMLAVALLGLTRAAVRAEIAPRVFTTIGAVGAALHMMAACFSPVTAEKTSPLMLVGLLGFACWVAFVSVAGWTLLHTDAEVVR